MGWFDRSQIDANIAHVMSLQDNVAKTQALANQSTLQGINSLSSGVINASDIPNRIKRQKMSEKLYSGLSDYLDSVSGVNVSLQKQDLRDNDAWKDLLFSDKKDLPGLNAMSNDTLSQIFSNPALKKSAQNFYDNKTPSEKYWLQQG